MNKILYHGSDHIIKRPEYGKGKRNNDYGRGFYCTENLELAKEWACAKQSDGYDVIIGYRADDSYFSFAQDFVSGAISLQKLSEAMKLGRLGEQIVLKSRTAFERLKYAGSEPANAEEYYIKKIMRDREARKEYRKKQSSSFYVNELFILDIMREGMEHDDPRLR